MSELTSIILIRHGQTEWNNAARFQGHMDSPLTEVGVRQARALGARLKGRAIDSAYSSDLGRAVQTAEQITAQTGHSIITDKRLRERAFGVFEGRSRAEVMRDYPEEWNLYQSRDTDYAAPGGQSAREHLEIGRGCLEELASRHPGGTILVVTHGGLLNGIFRHILGLPLNSPRKFSLQNAAYNLLTWSKGEWSIETWGDKSHFPLDLRDAPSFVESAPLPSNTPASA